MKSKSFLLIVRIIFFYFLFYPMSVIAQWSELGGINGVGPNYGFLSVTNDPNGNIYAAMIDGTGKNVVKKWSKLSNVWQDLIGSGALAANDQINALCSDPSGNIYAAGSFTNSAGKYYVAVWNGLFWSELGGVNALAANAPIYSLRSDASGNLYAGGEFTNGATWTTGKRYVAKWNGSNWSELGGANALGNLGNGSINTICVDNAGNVYAAGGLTNTSGKKYVAKWNGVGWSELGSPNGLSANASISTLCADPAGNIYAAGFFKNNVSNGKNYVATFSSGVWSELGGLNALSASNNITSITSDVSGNIYAAGNFTNSSFKYYVAKWNGSLWSELGGDNSLNANGGINSICLDANGNLFAAGNFQNVSGNNYVARYGATSSQLPPTITSFSPTTGIKNMNVNIAGTNFNGATNVSFGGISATSFTINSSTSISATVGIGASGSVSVTTPGGTASLAGFTYIPPPAINSFSPSSAGTGTTVTITGANFSGANTVSFGNTPASSYTVINSTTITAIVGAGESGSIGVTTPSGTATLAGFNYCASLSTPTITITASPGRSVCPGTSVTFTAAISNGGTNPSYQWRKNGVYVGINSATYSDASLNQGDTITCLLSSNANCLSTPIAGSNNIIMNVATPGQLSLPGNNFNVYGVASSSGSGCYTLTSNTQFNATGMMWHPSTVSLNTDFDFTFQITQSGGADGMAFVMHRNGSNLNFWDAGSDLSYYGIQNPHSNFTQSLAIEFDLHNGGSTFNDADNSHIALVKNKSVVPLKGPYSITPLLGSGNTNVVRIVWSAATKVLTFYLNGNVLFTHNDDIANTIFGGNSDVNFGFTAGTGGLAATQQVCVQNLLTGQPASPAVAISANVVFPVCSGTSVTFTATPFNGGNTPAYQWRKNGVNVGTNSASYTDATLKNNDTITCLLTSNLTCLSAPSAESNRVVVRTNPLPTAVITVTGSLNICTGDSVLLSATVSSNRSYQWIRGTANIAGATNSTYFAKLSGGHKVLITNTLTGCSRTSAAQVITLYALPTVAAITGSISVCKGSTTQLSNATPGGTWSSSNTAVATVSSTGLVTGINTGSVTITYTSAPNINGCIKKVTATISVKALPGIAAITGTRTVCAGKTTQLANTTIGGTWSSSDLGIATVSSTGLVTGVNAGSVTITYTTAPSSFGCTNKTSTIVTVSAPCPTQTFYAKSNIEKEETSSLGLQAYMYPNPTGNVFNVRVKAPKQESINIRVLDVNGRTVFSFKGMPNQVFHFGELLKSGTYLVEVRQGEEVKLMKAVKQ